MKRRLELPTSEELYDCATKKRRKETFNASLAIHGGTSSNKRPAMLGMIDTLTAKYKVKTLADELYKSKPKLAKALIKKVPVTSTSEYEKSEKNYQRSLNVFYSHDVLGKETYRKIRSASSIRGSPKLLPYCDLARRMRQIPIGKVIPISPSLTDGLDKDEVWSGCYRSLEDFAPRLAQHYLLLNELREDKLLQFPNLKGKDPSSVVFAMAIGGDEAPGAGTSYLLSFLNIGKRIASSTENFLIFGANVKETSKVVERYLHLLKNEIKQLESKIFKVKVGKKDVNVEFRLEALPNDLKNLAFLAGELTVSAKYFSTFGNVTYDDINDVSKTYGTHWKPFKYKNRLLNAKKVAKKKKELLRKGVKGREPVTVFIFNLGCRQEFEPLLGESIDKAKSEGVHLKNNFAKEQFTKVLDVIKEEKMAYQGIA